MKKYTALAIILWVIITTSIIASSHPDEKNNGIGSSRFPDHYASPTHPIHP